MAKAIPQGYHSVNTYLAMHDAAKAIEFYKKALGAKEPYRLPMDNGKVAHAELQVGDSRIMLSDEAPEWGARSPASIGGTPIGLVVYVENVDDVGDRFIKAGGKMVKPIENQFYGDRSGQYEDPEGYKWTLATHVEDVSPDEMKKRMANMPKKQG